ncbi:MAG: L-lactate permease, partial [Verrucomicrobiota bacterium]|nr:L-lactate permease [Verrucomicrobiota bacterium]
MGSLKISNDEEETKERPIRILQAWLPYVLVGVFLVLSRTIGGLEAWLKGWHVTLHSPLEGTLSPKSFDFLYLPGAIFILVSIITFFLHRMDWPSYKRAWGASFRTTAAASIALVFTVPMVQIFINSGGGGAGYAKMPEALAEGVAALAGGIWPIFSPFIGGLGAFVAGSNTMSNMMLSLFQFNTGQAIGANPSWIVALQAIGGAAGNMICVHNVVAASAVAGLVGREGLIIRKTAWGFLYYALFAGSLGYAIVSWKEQGLLNIGFLVVLMIWGLAAALIVLSERRWKRSHEASPPTDSDDLTDPLPGAIEPDVPVEGDDDPSNLTDEGVERGKSYSTGTTVDPEEEMDPDKWLAQRESRRRALEEENRDSPDSSS